MEITENDQEQQFAAMQQMGRGTIMEALQISLVEMDEGRIELEMPITDASRQPFGLLHGGVNMVLAESAASMHACWGVDLTRMIPVGIEINGSHLNSAMDGTVRAIGKVIRRSRRLVVHEVEIYHKESERLLCVSRVTNYYKSIGEPGTG